MTEQSAAKALAQGEFPGADELVALLDRAVAHENPEAITAAIKRELCSLISSGRLQLPDSVLETREEHYARRLVYRSPEHGYSVVAMTWGPGQGTPLHDHCGLWCVEGVCHGRIDVDQFDLVEERDGRCRFRPAESVEAGVGTAGCLIPPYEYHLIRNAGEETAVTLHIYEGDMTYCHTYEPVEGEWYRRESHPLSFDS